MPTTTRSGQHAPRIVAVALAAAGLAGCLPAALPGSTAPVASAPAVASVAPATAPAAAATAAMTASPTPSASTATTAASTSPEPPATAAATPSPTPAPVRAPVDVNLLTDPASHFISEVRKTWCAAAGTQMVLAMNDKVALSAAAQARIVARSAAYWSWDDSHNKGWGPAMIARVLAAYGVPGYVVRTYRSRSVALLDAAKAIEATHQPDVLLVWWGAHTWVVTGFRATADPLAFSDAAVTGMYVLDPWYPRISSIWGASDPPGTFQDAKEMARNYIRWTRPEGAYPARDGRFVAVIPTLPKP